MISIVLAFQCLGVASSRALEKDTVVFIYCLRTDIFHILSKNRSYHPVYCTFCTILYALPTKYVWLSPVIDSSLAFTSSSGLPYFPYFQRKSAFIKYDFEHYSEGRYRLCLSDAIRLYSIQAGMSIIKESPFIGKGSSNFTNLTTNGT